MLVSNILVAKLRKGAICAVVSPKKQTGRRITTYLVLEKMAMPGGFGVSQGPQVTIRQIKKDSVDFVLSNVDLA
jgi:hypothetical protein